MEDPRRAADTAAQKRLQSRRRAKRGLIAGYIHQLSDRHNGSGASRPRGRSADQT